MPCQDHVSPDPPSLDELPSFAPADQPSAVHELADRLLPAYTVDGGMVRLAGCLIEDRPFLRAVAHRGDRKVELFLDSRGQQVEPTMVDSLGMNQTIKLLHPPAEAASAIRRLAELAGETLARRLAESDTSLCVETTVVWCKFAEGKLRFSIGDAAVDLPFAGWARSLRPPPFVCPHSNQATYHLTAIGDGRIVAAERVAICQASGRRVLVGDLVTCTATGRRVLPEFTQTCPVTGEIVLKTETVPCSMCCQNVAPGAIWEGRCDACNGLEPVSTADPRLARVFDEHPLLERWRRWFLSESATAYHLMAKGWFRRLLVVVDKDSFGIRLLATGHRLRSGWEVVEPSQYEFVLRE